MRRLVTLLVLTASCSGRAPPVASPVPSGDAGTTSVGTAHATSTSTCETCHATIATEWRGSYHRTAFSDATFQRSLALEEPSARGFCIRCHAPEEKTNGDTQATTVATGVGCISCHGDVPRTADPSAPSRSPHPLTVDAAFSTAKACASCHQFAFDDGRPDLVQKTLDEHAASSFANVSCATCHMPRRAGNHADHSFVAGHSPEWIGKSVHASATRVANDRVRITLRSSAGHAFPTGDMFRRVRLLVFGEAETGAIVASEERTFGRTWGRVRGGEHDGMRRELADTRIRGRFDEEIRLTADEPIAKIHWVLRFERILAMRGPDAADVTLESSDVIAEGDARSSSISDTTK